MRRSPVFALALFAFACASDPQDTRLAPPAPGEGFQMGVEMLAPPGQELYQCVVEPLPVPDGFHAVNRVESEQTPNMHHMNIMALGVTGIQLPRGTHDCNTLYHEHPELMDKGLYIYASQAERQEVQLPPSVAAFLPGGIDVMYEIHYVNATTQPIEIYSRVNAYTIPDSEAKQSIWGYTMRDVDLNLPPNAATTEWTRCVMNQPVDVLFLATHTHRRGKKTTIARFDGTSTGAMVYENLDWHRPLLLPYTDAPLHVEAGSGFELRCDFVNDGASPVHWGPSAEDEMCQFTMVFTPGDSTAKCETVDSGVSTES